MAFFPQPKPLPRSLDAREDKAQALRDELKLKAEIKADAKYRCIVCGRKATDGHEIRPKSLGGIVSRQNTIPVDRPCHDLLQQWRITVENVKPSRGQTWPDATKPLFFIMAQSLADRLFDHRAVPPSVHIVPGGV